MKLSISSSSVFGIRENGKVTFMPEFAIAQCAKAGFTRMEYNFLTGPANSKPLAGDNWQDRVLQLKDVLTENNMTVPYTHDFWFLMANAKGAEDIAHKEEQIRRSVAATAMLGCKNMVVHTQSVYDAEGYNLEKTNAYNQQYRANAKGDQFNRRQIYDRCQCQYIHNECYRQSRNQCLQNFTA